MTTAHIFKVFTDSRGHFGDKASIVIDDGRQISDEKRIDIARKLNTGETIFVNNLKDAQISVVHPQGEIGFAGVGLLATAWLLSKLKGEQINKIVGRDGDIHVKQEGSLIWAQADTNTLPKWNINQAENPSVVEKIRLEDTSNMEHTLVWAWINENKGLIRARTFATDWEIPEAEGNGSGIMLLATLLHRNIEVRHGKGSVAFAKPTSDNSVAIGGRVIEKEERNL